MLAFSHIPKTAGTTLSYLLQKNFGASLNAVIPRKGAIYNYDALKKDHLIYSNPSCISGHGLKPFIDYKEYNDNLQWFTFLRNPINRFVSQYIHQQTASFKQYHLPIKEWATNFNRSNWQVKWIAGEEDLEAAMQIIDEKFIFVGLTEKFDESLSIFSTILKNSFDVNFDVTYTKSKMTGRDSLLKKTLLKDNYKDLEDFYYEKNELDIKLYNYVVENVFNKQLMNNEIYSSKKSNSEFETFINLNLFKLKRNLLYKPFVYLNR